MQSALVLLIALFFYDGTLCMPVTNTTTQRIDPTTEQPTTKPASTESPKAQERFHNNGLNDKKCAITPNQDPKSLKRDCYCTLYKNHYAHFCAALKNETTQAASKPDQFCTSFESNCIKPSEKKSPDNNDSKKRGSADGDGSVPLVIPPPIPFASPDSNRLDLPIGDGGANSAVKPLGLLGGASGANLANFLPGATSGLLGNSIHASEKSTAIVPAVVSVKNPAVIKTCTADCKAPQCTTECKCDNSHASVQTKCNPPADAETASTCQAWYAKCPMYKPIQF